jgi:hypothetical protein
MATYSKKMMGKEVGSASVYAEPHTMTGKKVKASTTPGKSSGLETLSAMQPRMSVGMYNNSQGREQPKTSGVKIRGTGCATKGTTARGPMA